jgi:hypothetical protein
LEQGAIIKVDPSGQKASLFAWDGGTYGLGKEDGLDGPVAMTIVNNYLYVANTGDSSAVVHRLIQINLMTGEQKKVNDLGGLKVLSGIAPNYINTTLDPNHVLVLDQGGNVGDPTVVGQVYKVDFMNTNPVGNGEFGPTFPTAQNPTQHPREQGRPDALAVDPLTGICYAGTEGDYGDAGAVVKVPPSPSDPLTTIALNDIHNNFDGTDGVTVGFGPYGPSTIFVDMITSGGRVTAVNPYADSSTPYDSAQTFITEGDKLGLLTGLKVYWDPTQVNLVNFETNDHPNPDPISGMPVPPDPSKETVNPVGAAIVSSPALDGNYSLQLLRDHSVANAEIRQRDKMDYNLTMASYSFLFRYGQVSGGDEGGIVNFQDTSGGYKCALHLSAAGRLLLYDINGGTPIAVGTTTLNPGIPYTISAKIGTGMSASYEIRINGNLELSGTGNFGTNNNGSLLLGGRSSYTTNYYYDDVSINNMGQDPSSSTTVTSSVNPSVLGQSVTFTATITPNGPGTPTGTVTFRDGTTPLGQATVSTSGGVTRAAITTSVLMLGSHVITANYSGDSSFGASSATLTQTVNKAGTSTTVFSSANPSASGQSVTFTAIVSVNAPGSTAAGYPAGTVIFSDGGTSIGQGTLSTTGGIATFSTSSLSIGNHTISASYAGSSKFLGSTGTFTQTVSTIATTTTQIASSANPSVCGQYVTFTVFVTSNGSGTPDGMVFFYDGSTKIGQGPLSMSSPGVSKATFLYGSLAFGNHTITASYAGSSGFVSSTGALTSGQTVNRASTGTKLMSSANPSTSGQPVTFTAMVTIASPGTTALGPPTGVVIFRDGSTSIGQGTLIPNGSMFSASFSTNALTIGSHVITASYGGDGNFVNSASALTQTVNNSSMASTTTVLTSSANPSVFPQAVTFTATVTPFGSGTPTGAVSFFDGPRSLGQGTLSTSGGITTATVTTSSSIPLSIGTHTITATYSGDGNFSASSNFLAQNVLIPNGTSPTTTAVSTSASSVTAGQPVTFTATVSKVGSSPYVPTGTVQFQADGFNLGGLVTVSTVSNVTTATLTTTALAAGTHAITATYGGDRNFSGSSGSLSGGEHVITGSSSTALSVASSVTPSVFGQTVTLTAAILTSGTGIPTGAVSFFDSGTNIGQAPVVSSGNLAMGSISIASLTVGQHTITASYGGDSNFLASSGALSGGQTVNQANTSTAVSSSANPSSVGQLIRFTATVSAVAPGSTLGGTPTGMVTFFDGSTSLGQAPLSTTGGVATATYSSSSLTAGNHTVTASYAGDSNFLASSGTLTQTVSNSATVSTTTMVSSSANPSRSGQPVTFLATVTPYLAGSPTGSVTFYDGATSLGQASVSTMASVTTASITVSSLTAGTHTITATYSGDNIFMGSNATLASGQAVSSTGSYLTSIQVTSSASPVQAGLPVTLTAHIYYYYPNVPTGTVQFQVDGSNFGAPAVVTGSFGQASAALTTSSLPMGAHTVTAHYNGDGNYAPSSGTLAGGQSVVSRGDVVATLNGGELDITVAAGGGFTLSQDWAGNFDVFGNGSSVNNSGNPATFSAVSAISIVLANGNNDVTLSSLSIPGSITISAGSGADSFTLNGVNADLINLGGAGPDTVNVSNVSARNDLNITVGAGSQAVAVTGTVCLDLNIQAQSASTDNLNINLQNDTVTHTTQGGLSVNDSAGTGTDTVTLDNSQSNLWVGYQLAVMLSSGSNTLSAESVTTLFGTVDGGTSGNNNYTGLGGNLGYALYDFLGY